MKVYPRVVLGSLLFTALLPLRLMAQPVALPSSWGEFDLQEQQKVSAGLLTLINQSSSGFTATVSSNGYVPPYPARSQYLPRVYAFFEPQQITNLGARVSVSFDIVFKTVVDPSNSGSFRFTLGDTNANNSLLGAITIGSGTGTLNRYDIAITQDTNWIDSVLGNYLYVQPNPAEANNLSMGSLCDGGANMSSFYHGPMPPNSVALGVDTTTVHHVRLSVERTRIGDRPALQNSLVWANSAGSDVFENAGSPIAGGNGDDGNGLPNVLPWKSINILGFCLFGTGGNQHFFGYDPGTYTISNLKVYSGFNLTAFTRNPGDGSTTLKWESSRADVCEYKIESSTDLSSWSVLAEVPSAGPETSYTDSTAGTEPRYYRVSKLFR